MLFKNVFETAFNDIKEVIQRGNSNQKISQRANFYAKKFGN